VSQHILIAGGGIGGLGVALALGQIGLKVTVLEQSSIFGEVGAGVQVSPNAYKVLCDWGLADVVKQTVNFPEKIQVRSTANDKLLGQLELGNKAQLRYGFPFATIHRADLHTLLLNAVRQLTNVDLHLNAKIVDIVEVNQQVKVTTEVGASFTADALIGADGLRSRVRQYVFDETTPSSSAIPSSSPSYTGHTAWRALLPMAEVPSELQQDKVTAWLAPDSHTIAYPVQQGKSLNLVYCVEYDSKIGLQPAYLLPEALSKLLQKTFKIATDSNAWTRWDLFGRPPLSSSAQMCNPVHPHIALLGDAAHPMLPYLAQGAGMALEDAQVLAWAIEENPSNLPSALQLYAQTRWQRNAKVQTRAARNGQIFHAKPHISWARDAAMAVLGEKLLDSPWLYGGVNQ
jgi:salicylate hydroxylase